MELIMKKIVFLVLVSWGFLIAQTPPISGNWELKFEDDFNGSNLDPMKWRLGQHFMGTSGQGQAGYDGTNVTVQNSKLKIKAEKKNVIFGGRTYNYASAVLSTYQEFRLKYGYFEAKIKYDAITGVWPAFWTMPDRGDYGNISKTRESYLKFDLSGYSNNVSLAILKVKVTDLSPTTGTGNITVHKLLSNLWDEGSLTWSNKPQFDPVWIKQLTYTTDANLTNQITVGQFIEIDVTDYVNAQINGNESAGFALIDNFMRTVNIKFASKETNNTNDKPRLSIDGNTVYPSDDAYVRAGATYKNQNYGTEATLELEDSWGSTSSTYNGGMEVDIMESLGVWGDNVTQHAVHWDGYEDDHKSDGSGQINLTPTSDGYHVYGMSWRPDTIDFYIDGVKTWTFDSSRVGSISSYVLLSHQMGGWNTSGNQIPDDINLPATMEIDYVRVWKNLDIPEPFEPVYQVSSDFSGSWVKYSMYDDATHGDVTANDGIHTVDITITPVQTNGGTWYVEDINNNILWPVAGNGGKASWFVTATDNQVVKFIYDTNTNTEGWFPTLNVGNADDQPISGESFYTKVFGGVGNEIMYDDGTHGDILAGDNIFSTKKIISNVGTYDWVATRNGTSEKHSWGINGRQKWAGNDKASFTTTQANQDMYFYLNLNDGRLKTSTFSFVKLKTKIFLEGPYNSTTDEMNTDLQNDIPLTSPYAEDPRTVNSIPVNIIDWVLIQLRTTVDGNAITSRSAFLRKDGIVVSDDGITEEIKLEAPVDNYFIVVKHRNHLSVISDEAVPLNEN